MIDDYERDGPFLLQLRKAGRSIDCGVVVIAVGRVIGEYCVVSCTDAPSVPAPMRKSERTNLRTGRILVRRFVLRGPSQRGVYREAFELFREVLKEGRECFLPKIRGGRTKERISENRSFESPVRRVLAKDLDDSRVALGSYNELRKSNCSQHLSRIGSSSALF